MAIGRFWPPLRLPKAHRFITVAAVAGAVVVSVAGSAMLHQRWESSRVRDEAAAAFFVERGLTDDVVMHGDPLTLHQISGNPAVAPPYDPYPVIQRVAEAYDVRWLVITLGDESTRDPLGLWEGGESVDREGNRATWLADEPAFEADGVRIYEVVPRTIGSP